MPLTSFSSKRGVTGCLLSVCLALREQRVQDGRLSQGENGGINRNPMPKGHARSDSPDLGLAGPKYASAF